MEFQFKTDIYLATSRALKVQHAGGAHHAGKQAAGALLLDDLAHDLHDAPANPRGAALQGRLGHVQGHGGTCRQGPTDAPQHQVLPCAQLLDLQAVMALEAELFAEMLPVRVGMGRGGR